MSDFNSDPFLVEGAIIEDWEEKDEVRQIHQLGRLAEALRKVTTEDPNNKRSPQQIQGMVENSKIQWKEESDKSIDIFIEIQKQMSDIKQNPDINEESKRAFGIFSKKIEKELARIEKYIYFDLACEQLEFKDIKYLIRCLVGSYPRLSKFQKFLEDFEDTAQGSGKGWGSSGQNQQIFGENFEMMMNIEFKIQQVEPKIKVSQGLMEGLEEELNIINWNVDQMKKKYRKMIYESQVWQSMPQIKDQVIELNYKFQEHNKIIKKMRKELYNESLLDFAGSQKFSQQSNSLQNLLEAWMKVPQTMEAQLQKNAENVTRLREKIRGLQKCYDDQVAYQKEKKNKPGFFQKLIGGENNNNKNSKKEIK